MTDNYLKVRAAQMRPARFFFFDAIVDEAFWPIPPSVRVVGYQFTPLAGRNFREPLDAVG